MYTYKIGEGVDYPLFLFTSKLGFTFNVRFENFPYDFHGIEVIRTISVGCDDNVAPPLDRRVGETVCAIIEAYLSQNHSELLSYVCDNLDGKGLARQRKFGLWHSRYGGTKYIAAPQTIATKDGTEIYTCLIFDPAVYDESALLESYQNEIKILEQYKI